MQKTKQGNEVGSDCKLGGGNHGRPTKMMVTWTWMVGMIEMGSSELTDILIVVFAGLDDGLDER